MCCVTTINKGLNTDQNIINLEKAKEISGIAKQRETILMVPGDRGLSTAFIVEILSLVRV